MISIVNDVKEDEWNDFVNLHPFGNIYQTMEMYKVYKNTKNYYPLKLCAVNENTNEIEVVLSAAVIQEINGFLGKFSTHSVVQGGPLVSNNSIATTLTELITKYDKLVEKKTLFTEIRNLYDVSQLFNNIVHYKHEEHLNFLINLNQSEKELWQQIHKPRRKNINRAIKKGIIIEEMTSKKMLLIFYKLLQETYNNAKIPLADITLFESAFEQLMQKNMVKFFLATHKDTYIGARAILMYKNVIYDWYAGASKEALSLYPNDYLVWHILKWGVENNYTLFDFGGAGKPDVKYGPREFKRRFGGKLVNYGRYINIHSPMKMKITKIGFGIYRRLI